MEPESPLTQKINEQNDQAIPDGWNQRVSRDPKLTDKKIRQYPTAGARESPEA